MPTISKIRFTHVIYEGGNKRYNDETFVFHGHNGAVVLENGGGKTVFIQTAIQAVLPHADLAGRKVKDTLMLDNGPAHIAIEWILNDKPRRRYALTCVSLFHTGTGIDSLRYVYEYGEHDSHRLDELPFVRMHMDKARSADKGEMQDYFSSMEQRYPLHAKTFPTIKEYKAYLEQQFQIITGEWEAIVKINDTEGGIEGFFDECKTTTQLFDRLLIPTIERSIEGYEQGSFAKMFEAHREGFEKYKQLKEQIDENKNILQELGGYVKLYESLDREQKQYNMTRSKAKAYWLLSVEQHKELEDERGRLIGQHEDLERRSGQLVKQGKSLAIIREKQDQEALESKLLLIEEDREQTKEHLDDAQRHYYSLQYAEYRDREIRIAAKIKQLEQQLASLVYSDDEAELQKRWERNGAGLRYLFSASERELEGVRLEKDKQLREFTEQMESTRARLSACDKELSDQEILLSAKQTEKRLKREQQEQIARAILSNPQLEKVEQQLPIWSAEEQQLEQSRIELLQELKRLQEERLRKETRRKAASEERAEAERELAKLMEQEQQQRTEHEEVKGELARLRRAWERLGSLYEKQASISELMTETIDKLQREKNKLLLTERLAYRYVDDHGGQELFFADASIAKLAEQWSQQFSLLQLGTDYILDMAELVSAEKRKDRLWAVTLITTEHEKEALCSKLLQVKEGHSFPIRVMSTKEAAEVLQGQGNLSPDHGQWVVPEHWIRNEQLDSFALWQTRLAEQAEHVRSDREKVEAEIAEWQAAQQLFRSFLVRFPLQAQQELEQKCLLENAKLTERKRELERLEYELAVNQESEEQRRRTAEDMASRIVQLGLWLQECRRYMVLASEGLKLDTEIGSVMGQLELLQKRKLRQEEQLLHVQAEYDKLWQAAQDIRNQQQLLRRDERYEEVLIYEAEAVEGSLEELKEERRGLELQRHRIFQERTQLEADMAGERERQRECRQALEQLLMEHVDIVQNIPVPLDVEERKKMWWANIQEIAQVLSRVEGEYKRTEEEHQQKQGALAMLMRQFNEQYPDTELDTFHESLGVVKERLAEEEKALRSEEEQLKMQQRQLAGQQKEFDEVTSLWNKHLLLHALEDVTLNASAVSEDDRSEFRYKRKLYTEQLIEQLNSRYGMLTDEQRSVQKGRQRLKDYFGNRVKDVKLRQMTLQGIETKESYEEISEFQKSMEQRIQMAIHIWEQTLQTHDQELQQYIQHIHAHLKLIVQELKEIPKKTRVKTDEGWKEIYSFSIPEWEENDGKERIRKHIDWIMGKLDRYGEAKEQDSWQEQQAVIRKDLEKWLDARQLIQIVMMGEGMKVTCRKVSNDQQVSKVAYSWEQSNRWSGGEKWSKNMTLFLGLLNYVAERKQYIQARMQRHRTVILDNPFGKASSDHVLSPVFFIAEQLGFQMIALTAHVEGKFLQDYFPIVYSCRLRYRGCLEANY